jgi:hypothetical protein
MTSYIVWIFLFYALEQGSPTAFIEGMDTPCTNTGRRRKLRIPFDCHRYEFCAKLIRVPSHAVKKQHSSV